MLYYSNLQLSCHNGFHLEIMQRKIWLLEDFSSRIYKIDEEKHLEKLDEKKSSHN